MDTDRLKQMLKITQCSKETTVLACDQLPSGGSRKPAPNTAFIVNLQESWRPGNHWIVLYVVNENIVELFDSLVTNSDVNNKYIRKFVSQFHILKKNSGARLQDTLSETCGLYCVYFIFFRCKKEITIYQIIDELFSDDTLMNECRVVAFTNEVFQKQLFQHIRHGCVT